MLHRMCALHEQTRLRVASTQSADYHIVRQIVCVSRRVPSNVNFGSEIYRWDLSVLLGMNHTIPTTMGSTDGIKRNELLDGFLFFFEHCIDSFD